MVVVLVETEEQKVQNMVDRLTSPETSLPTKYRLLFSLRNVKNASALRGLVYALQDTSILFRHDVAFCLGQRQQQEAVAVLINVLKDPTEHPMVRHEAGEALGAIGSPECIAPLKKHRTDEQQEVRETCQLALQRVQHYTKQQHQNQTEIDENKYLSVDPTPALPASTPLEQLRETVLDENAEMFERYRALFALRNKGGQAAIGVLSEIFDCSSALLKHEVAYVLGQMQDKQAVQTLSRVLVDTNEHPMVRHEAAEALGAIGDADCIDLLKQQCSSQETIVADSCVVALDMMENGQDVLDDI
eukprot:TRINITY_DN611_c0_g3_i1.p3 TRINITY_DN611_c0_g3~~TRINITY_DN611_c0_g3_i1.p3  ORF type:complete len:302 (-),score=31.00 TRINITY_DN611_c0_g3_i1:784-1689(-)